MGSWVTHGLGTENQNLPGFIAMCPGGYPIQESQNWQSGFLPGVGISGTYIDTQHTKIEKLIEHIKNNYTSLPEQRQQLDLLQQLNERHQRKRKDDALEARIQSSNCVRMQMTRPMRSTFRASPKTFGRCAAKGRRRGRFRDRAAARGARRALRAGVARTGPAVGQSRRHRSEPSQARERHGQGHRCVAQGLEAARTLEETLVVWGGESGRTLTVKRATPGSNAGKINGRDHNHHGFTMWLAGGGVRAVRPRSDRRVCLSRPLRIGCTFTTCDDPLAAGLRPRKAHVPPRRPGLPAHRRTVTW